VKRATVLVCTHNRADVLPAALESLEHQTLPASEFEVLVIDNASTDATKRVVEEQLARTKIDLRYVHEPKLGLCVARNRGVAEAKGELIAFLDDDARAEPGWLAALVTVHEETKAPVVGGIIRPDWQVQPPGWFFPALMKYLIVLDLGPQRRPVEKIPFFYGTNMAFHRSIFEKLGTFRTDLDRVGTILAGGGDTEMCLRVHRAGMPLMYEPGAVVHHQIPASRLQPEFFRTRFYYSGRARAAHTVEPLPVRIAMACVLGGGALALAPFIGLARLAGQTAAALQLERLAFTAAGWLHHQIL
jgi:glycosyltransferase involved in cell wall biosynthesis